MAAKAESKIVPGEISGNRQSVKAKPAPKKAEKSPIKVPIKAKKTVNAAAKPVAAANPSPKPVIAKAEDEAVGNIVYQESSQMLERVAEPNEIFMIGDSMPVYYF